MSTNNTPGLTVEELLEKGVDLGPDPEIAEVTTCAVCGDPVAESIGTRMADGSHVHNGCSQEAI